MTEGTSREAGPLPCTHPRQFRWEGGKVVGQEPCSWCGPTEDSPVADVTVSRSWDEERDRPVLDSLVDALAVPTVGPAKQGPMETGWHEDATGPYLTALAGLRDAVVREQDRVQVGSLPGEAMLSALHTVHTERANYLRAVARALGGPIPAEEVDATPIPTRTDRCADGHVFLKPGCHACNLYLTRATDGPVRDPGETP